MQEQNTAWYIFVACKWARRFSVKIKQLNRAKQTLFYLYLKCLRTLNIKCKAIGRFGHVAVGCLASIFLLVTCRKYCRFFHKYFQTNSACQANLGGAAKCLGLFTWSNSKQGTQIQLFLFGFPRSGKHQDRIFFPCKQEFAFDPAFRKNIQESTAWTARWWERVIKVYPR